MKTEIKLELIKALIGFICQKELRDLEEPSYKAANTLLLKLLNDFEKEV